MQRGIDGTVEIESPNQAVNPVDVDLNTGFQDFAEFISNNCNPTADRSHLIVRNMNPVRRSPPVIYRLASSVVANLLQ
ncbi:MAG: hypothetical protein ACE37D_22495 [Pseudomonadales bacterium]